MREKLAHAQDNGSIDAFTENESFPLRNLRRLWRGHLRPRVTKAAKILSLLKQSDGATLKRIMVVTGWQAHSVRGFISGHLVKKLQIRVQSLRRDGERVYKIES